MIYYQEPIEKITNDFYCDIAINMFNEREKQKITQKELSKLTKIPVSRIQRLENVQLRFKLSDVKAIANVLHVTENNLINAEPEWNGEECLYLVWPCGHEDFKLYVKAISKRMAFLKYYQKVTEDFFAGFFDSRQRFMVEIMGVPTNKEEAQSKLGKYSEKSETIEKE